MVTCVVLHILGAEPQKQLDASFVVSASNSSAVVSFRASVADRGIGHCSAVVRREGVVVADMWIAENASTALNKSGLVSASCGMHLVKCQARSLRSYHPGRVYQHTGCNRKDQPFPLIGFGNARSVPTCQVLHVMRK